MISTYSISLNFALFVDYVHQKKFDQNKTKYTVKSLNNLIWDNMAN
jgi:hypothetical protein